MKKALLLSGGLDSTALAFWIRPSLAITIDYGQIAAPAEITAAQSITKELAINHDVLHIDCSILGTGDMSLHKQSYGVSVQSDWWPFRNQLIISIAAARCLAFGIEELYIGSVKTDSKFKDGTYAFYELMEKLLYLQEGNLKLCAPALNMTTNELLTISEIPMALAAWSHSCHCHHIACGQCKGCIKRYQVMVSQWGIV